jgi:hypothetical protein
MAKLSAKKKSELLVNEFGKETSKIMVSNTIMELSLDGFAYSNIHQLKFWVKVLEIILKQIR